MPHLYCFPRRDDGLFLSSARDETDPEFTACPVESVMGISTDQISEPVNTVSFEF
jgi:hypothetical protein